LRPPPFLTFGEPYTWLAWLAMRMLHGRQEFSKFLRRSHVLPDLALPVTTILCMEGF